MKKRLLAELRDKKIYIYISAFLQVVDMLLLTLIIERFARITSKFFIEKKEIEIISYIIIGILIVIKALNIYLTQVVSNYISKIFTINLRNKFYKKLLNLKEKDYEKISSTDFMILYNDGIGKLSNFVSKSISFHYASITNILIFTIILTSINWLLGICVVLGAILIPLGMNVVRKAAKKIVSDKWKSYVNLSENFLDNLNGLTTLKIYQSDEYRNKEMNSLSEDFRVKTMKSLAIRLNSITIMEMVTYVGMAITIILSIILNRKNVINNFHVIFIILVSFTLFIPARQLGTYAHSYRSAKMLSKRVYKMIDLENRPEKGMVLEEQINKLEIKDLTCRYTKSHDVLKGINLLFEGNGLYAIAGKSGSGKSTVLKTILNKLSYDGIITINGISLQELNETQLSKKMIAVSSEDFIFKGTVKENLLYACNHSSDEQLRDILLQLKLNFELDLMLDSGAKNISVGQRQRFILARALLYDADVYLLDEILSGVDSENEQIIMDVLTQLSKEKILICITHRLTSIRNAKEIYFLNFGEVVEHGRHSLLYESKNEYYRLYCEQNRFLAYGGNEYENI